MNFRSLVLGLLPGFTSNTTNRRGKIQKTHGRANSAKERHTQKRLLTFLAEHHFTGTAWSGDGASIRREPAGGLAENHGKGYMLLGEIKEGLNKTGLDGSKTVGCILRRSHNNCLGPGGFPLFYWLIPRLTNPLFPLGF